MGPSTSIRGRQEPGVWELHSQHSLKTKIQKKVEGFSSALSWGYSYEDDLVPTLE